MKEVWKAIKRSIRLGSKFGGTVLCGYPLQYARNQEPEDNPDYCHLWSESVTAIPQLGSPTVKQNRIWNLQLAARHIDGLILQPQQIFGFWNCVPRPTAANGFREGPVFVQGQVLTDVGGGLCLVATSLFQVLVRSGCEILERHGHSIDPYGNQRFFTLGQDASVAYGYKDLLARNTSQVSLKLHFAVLPDRAEVKSRLLGTAPCPIAVKVESTILEEIPPLEANGASGWRVQMVRSIRDQTNSELELRSHWQVDYCTTTVYQPCAGLGAATQMI